MESQAARATALYFFLILSKYSKKKVNFIVFFSCILNIYLKLNSTIFYIMRAFQQKTPSNYCGFHYLKKNFKITTNPYNRGNNFSAGFLIG